MVVNDTSRVVRSDDPSCGVTYGCHFDGSRGVIKLLKNIYSAGITQDHRHTRSSNLL
jgi:hypothetical protein